MSEVTFCKSFLTALDARPVKLSSDHIADARQYPAQGAVRLGIPFPLPRTLQHTRTIPTDTKNSTPSPASHTPLTPRDQTPAQPAMAPHPPHQQRSQYRSSL